MSIFRYSVEYFVEWHSNENVLFWNGKFFMFKNCTISVLHSVIQLTFIQVQNLMYVLPQLATFSHTLDISIFERSWNIVLITPLEKGLHDHRLFIFGNKIYEKRIVESSLSTLDLSVRVWCWLLKIYWNLEFKILI